MEQKRVALYERLPEIYRIKDEDLPEQYLQNDGASPAYQLRSYLALFEDMFGAIHENIESLYHDLFIETCDPWVIPYVGDLLGTTHLSADVWTLRADVADTIALRRRKGTLSAIELLTYILTKWGVHCVELFENMVWNQHLNHQRPDEGGTPPYSLPTVTRHTPIRGGTVNLRSIAQLSFLNTPFDPFAHVADVRPHKIGDVRYNLPNLAIFLWRVSAYRLQRIKPFTRKMPPAAAGQPFVVRININPIPPNNLSAPYVIVGNEPAGQPVRLFNTNRFDLFNDKRTGTDKLNLSAIAPRISRIDETPNPIPMERLSEVSYRLLEALRTPPVPPALIASEGDSAGKPEEYVSVAPDTADLSDVGLQFHLPSSEFSNDVWKTETLGEFWVIRGENLCAWETNLQPTLADREIAIDPVRGRIVIGIDQESKADALVNDLLLTFTYGAVGPVGAHPISYPALPEELTPQNPANVRTINSTQLADGLRNNLIGISSQTEPRVIEIADSRTYALDLTHAALAGDVTTESGLTSLNLNSSLVIRAADNQRPIIELSQPLGFRPTNVASTLANPQDREEEQKRFDAVMENITVRLEGIYLARAANFPANQPLISRAAINKIELINCTLDPGGFKKFNGTRAPVLPSLGLEEPYGFQDPSEELEFKQTPEIIIQRSITGPLLIDEGYKLCLTDSIVDAGQGVGNTTSGFAISGATNPNTDWGPATVFRGVTILGRTRVASIEGSGGIFVHALEVFNQQIGCIKYSYFSGEPLDLLPQNHACVKGTNALLRFNSEVFGEHAYCQLAFSTDRRVCEEGPDNDEMGAFGFLSEAHKWRNLQIRFREFMPVGIRPLLIPVT